jgi:hypothetical protein
MTSLSIFAKTRLICHNLKTIRLDFKSELIQVGQIIYLNIHGLNIPDSNSHDSVIIQTVDMFSLLMWHFYQLQLLCSTIILYSLQETKMLFCKHMLSRKLFLLDNYNVFIENDLQSYYTLRNTQSFTD